MNRKQEILKAPYIDRGAYCVPEGYFDTLQQNIMSRIPKEDGHEDMETPTTSTNRTFILRSRLMYTAAACMTGLMLTAGAMLYLHRANGDADVVAVNAQEEESIEQYAEDWMEYDMVGREDFYTYLSE